MKGQDGLLKCSVHNESFNTPTEFYEHQKSVPHGFKGTTKCDGCGCKNCEVDPNEQFKGNAKARCKHCEELEETAVLERIERKKKEKEAKKDD